MNIAEILRDCPKGTKLYSPLFGELELSFVEGEHISCITKKRTCGLFTSDGKYFGGYSEAECMLFPSRDQRDWSKFRVTDQKPKTELKPFDKVLVRDDDDTTWRCDFFRVKIGDKEGVFICLTTWWKQCIPYEGNEHLLGTTNKPEE